MLIVFGLLDLLTSVIGIGFLGATERNPLLASVSETGVITFSILKLAAVTLIGIMFYKAGKLESVAGTEIRVQSYFVYVAYSLSLVMLVGAVTNNMLVMVGLI